MSEHEMRSFIEALERHAGRVTRVLESLPEGSYDFRPDAGGRSLGELAWHLPELEAYMSWGVEKGTFSMGDRPPGIERPREIAALAPGYRRVHGEAMARVKSWKPDVFDRKIPFFDDQPHAVRDILWEATLHHSLHHLGQLTVIARLAGGKPPGLFGPNREETAAMREAMARAKG